MHRASDRDGDRRDRAIDVAVVGDGPAGSALARQLMLGGADVVLFGDDRPWDATYTTWVDDLDGVSVLVEPTSGCTGSSRSQSTSSGR